jgi:hypothetical protein
MTQFNVGQKVKYHTPFPDEDSDQIYLVLEVKPGPEDTRVDIKPLNIGLEFPPIYTVKSVDLIVLEEV